MPVVPVVTISSHPHESAQHPAKAGAAAAQGHREGDPAREGTYTAERAAFLRALPVPKAAPEALPKRLVVRTRFVRQAGLPTKAAGRA